MTDQNDSIFLKFLRIVWQYRKILLISNISVFVVTIIIALFMAKWYRGSITFMVNDKGENPFMSNLSNALPFNFIDVNNNKVHLYKNIIKSRRVLDSLDSLYQLQKYYEIEDRQKFYVALKSDIEVRDNDDNTLTVDFYYKEDPDKAAEISNQIFTELSKLSLDLNSEKNRNLRKYLENSYDITIKRLREAEQKLTEFQVENQIYDVEAQIKLIIDKITELEIEKIHDEIEMLFLKRNLAQDNQEVKALQTKILVIQEKINELKYSPSANDLSLSQLPQKSVEYMNLFRDVKVLNHILEFLIPQLENARLEELKKAPDIQIIDRAIPEDYKAKPKRISVVFTVSFLCLIFSSLAVTIHNYYHENKVLFQNLKKQ